MQYDVIEILKTMRTGKQATITTAEIIEKAKTATFCDPKIANHIKKAAAAWLMINYTE